jgi:glyoxalase family protein
MKLNGIHHLTAICGDPVRNVAFYTQTLGLRLVKRTVNFDDPGAWHLYYGDHEGHPGTILTFFSYVSAQPGKPGAGEVTALCFAIPPGSLGYWRERLESCSIPVEVGEPRFGEVRLRFHDPDGYPLELVEMSGSPKTKPWQDSPIPPEHALGAFYGVTFLLRGAGPTADVLTHIMGATAGPTEGAWHRFFLGEGESAARIDLFVDPAARAGKFGAGIMHHIAWRTSDDETQAVARQELRSAGLVVSPVRDRSYFQSIYYREPGGILFEIATDPPGFTTDEPVENLGSALRLPPQLERQREQIETILPPLFGPKEV